MTIQEYIAACAAVALVILFAIAFAREAMRDGMRVPRGWHSLQRYWRKWVERNGFVRTRYQDNRLARVLCYDEFVEKYPQRRARFYAKGYGFFYVGEKRPGDLMSGKDLRAMIHNVNIR